MTCFFSLKPFKIKTARLCDIIDGDSIILEIELFECHKYKFRCRIKHIDVPSLKCEHPCLRRKSKAAIKFMLSFLDIKLKKSNRTSIQKHLSENNVVVKVECGHFDKYGRVLINLFNDKMVNYGDELIKLKLAYRYDGGKKKTNLEQVEYLKFKNGSSSI